MRNVLSARSERRTHKTTQQRASDIVCANTHSLAAPRRAAPATTSGSHAAAAK
jgi:hypothetical protein